MSRYFLVLWQGSSDTDRVRWSDCYHTLILSKLCHGSFGDIKYQSILLNKDHQRMMVDPMLMIVLDLRLFLTAVSPTAVALTTVPL